MITVFGSISMDMFLPVRALPQPGQTQLTGGYALRPGGKGANQAVAAARMGAEVRLYGRVGEDEFGTAALDALAATGIDVAGVRGAARRTSSAAIFVDQKGENLSVQASGANMVARAEQVPDDVLEAPHLLLTQMEVSPEENWLLIRRAHARGSQIMLTLSPPGPVPDDIPRLLHVLVFADTEARAVARSFGLKLEDPGRICAELAARHDLIAACTMGPRGAVLAWKGNHFRLAPFDIQPVDATGSADAFAGILAAGLDTGMHPLEAARRAAIGAAIACLRLGAQESLPRKSTIEDWLPHAAEPQRF